MKPTTWSNKDKEEGRMLGKGSGAPEQIPPLPSSRPFQQHRNETPQQRTPDGVRLRRVLLRSLFASSSRGQLFAKNGTTAQRNACKKTKTQQLLRKNMTNSISCEPAWPLAPRPPTHPNQPFRRGVFWWRRKICSRLLSANFR
ncbi:unnamed protein product [Ectocarpus sp. 12 AP-2014]